MYGSEQEIEGKDMFTGLVTDIGTIRSVEDRNGLRRFEVESGYPLEEIALVIGRDQQRGEIRPVP